MKKQKKITKVKKITILPKLSISKSIEENKDKHCNASIPLEYKKLYNSLLYKLRTHVYIKPFSTIKFEISELQYDDEDIFYPYKFYIYLNNNDDKMKFELFLSNIICKYTIRLTDLSCDLSEELKKIKGYNKIDGIINEILSQYKHIYIKTI